MLDDTPPQRPAAVAPILADATARGFAMSCEDRTGALLAVLAGSKPGGRILELGTGAGVGAAWLLDGMDATATLLSVELDPQIQHIAAAHLGTDPRLTLVGANADDWLTDYTGPGFDLAYVDCRPGKFHRLNDLIALLNPGGLYLGDDLLAQPTWPPDHQARVDAFLTDLPLHAGLRTVLMNWASGLVVGVRT